MTTSLAPSSAARDQGWLLEPHLQPGTYFMRIEATGAAAPADVTFRIPQGTPPVTYVGSFHLACDGTAQACRIAPVPADETAAAAALVAAEASGIALPASTLARTYSPSIAALGLAPPAAPIIRIDTAAWAAAVDWSAFTNASQVPAAAPPPADAPRSEAPDWSEVRMVSTGDAAEGLGLIVALPVFAGALLIMVGVQGISRAIIRDQRNRQEADQARRDAEALRARTLAQEQWGPCAAGIGAALAPDNVERHLRAALPPARTGGHAAAQAGAWQATVTRVVLRHCGTAPDSHGVEVATRWTAQRPGEAEPAFDAMFTRSVAGATPDPRLVHARRPPWELPVASEAACRPLADYCGAGGSALLLQEVVRGVTEARDAVGGVR